MTFSEAVYVTGVPLLGIKVGSATRQARYASGSGTSVLSYTYTVTANEADDNGIEVERNQLTTPGNSSIKDAADNDAVLTPQAALGAQSGHKVDAAAPTAPAGFMATAQDGAAALSWTLSTDFQHSSGLPSYQAKEGDAGSYGAWTTIPDRHLRNDLVHSCPGLDHGPTQGNMSSSGGCGRGTAVQHGAPRRQRRPRRRRRRHLPG